MTFGKFLREKRTEKKFTVQSFAERIDVTPPFVSGIEGGRKTAPSDDVLHKIVAVLELNKEDTEKFYDLAAMTKTTNPIPADITDVIRGNSAVKIALRTAKDMGATDKEWEEFMRRLKEKREREGF